MQNRISRRLDQPQLSSSSRLGVMAEKLKGGHFFIHTRPFLGPPSDGHDQNWSKLSSIMPHDLLPWYHATLDWHVKIWQLLSISATSKVQPGEALGHIITNNISKWTINQFPGQQLLFIIGRTISPALIGRFKEREENVKADIFHAFITLLRNTRPAACGR